MAQSLIKRVSQLRRNGIASTMRWNERKVSQVLASMKQKSWVSEKKSGALSAAPSALRRNDLTPDERNLLSCLLGYQPISPKYSRLVKNEHGANGNSPMIAGTRVSVANIAFLIDAGEGINRILAAYPHLTEEDVRDVMRYHFSEAGPAIESVAV